MENDATAMGNDSIALGSESSATLNDVDCYGNGLGHSGPTGTVDGNVAAMGTEGSSGTCGIRGNSYYNGPKWYDPCIRRNSKRRKLRK